MNPSFGPVLRLLFRQPLESRSIYIDLRVLAAHLRMNFLHSKLLRWVYRELKFTMRGRVYDLSVAARLGRIKMNPIFEPVPRLLFRQPSRIWSLYVELRVRAA